MGFLDDYVKLQQGKSFTELFGSIASTVREVRAQDIIARNLQDLDLSQFKNVEELGRELALRKQTMMKTVPIDLQGTQAFTNVEKRMSDIAENVRAGVAGQSAIEHERATTGEIKAKTTELESYTKMMDTELPPIKTDFFPKQYITELKEKGMTPTLRNLSAVMELDKPYIFHETAKIQAGAAGKAEALKLKNDLFQFKTAFLTPAIGEYAQFLNFDEEGLNKHLLDNNWYAIAQGIAARAKEAGLDYQEVFAKVFPKVYQAAKDFGMTQTAQATAQMGAMSVAVENAYQQYEEAVKMAGGIPMPKQLFMERVVPKGAFPSTVGEVDDALKSITNAYRESGGAIAPPGAKGVPAVTTPMGNWLPPQPPAQANNSVLRPPNNWQTAPPALSLTLDYMSPDMRELLSNATNPKLPPEQRELAKEMYLKRIQQENSKRSLENSFLTTPEEE